MYWLNICFADGSESTYEESAKYPSAGLAVAAARKYHKETGGAEVCVIDPHATVIEHFYSQ